MKKFIPPYVFHREHPVAIKHTSDHNNAFYYCTKCQVWVGWLSKQEVKQAIELDLINK